MGDLKTMKEQIKTFCEERDWDQFHGPKDLAIGMVTEASELLEIFRFKSGEECLEILANGLEKKHIEEEVADVLFFVVRFCQRFDVDIEKAFNSKMAKNRKKYPVEKSFGSNKKYTEL